MKKTYIILGIIAIIIIGVVFAMMGKNAEAPVVNTENADVGTNLNTNEPAPLPVPTTPATVQTYTPPKVDKPSTATVKEFTVKGQNFSFIPSLITVKKGDRVKITFENTSGFHDFVIDEFGVATSQSKSPNTEVLEFTATKTGSFEYYCSVGSHRSMGMKGILKVE
ncbi:MAG: plastocyanin/azurin family copper-binding protein [Candidatus Paceibacterota bacterium]